MLWVWSACTQPLLRASRPAQVHARPAWVRTMGRRGLGTSPSPRYSQAVYLTTVCARAFAPCPALAGRPCLPPLPPSACTAATPRPGPSHTQERPGQPLCQRLEKTPHGQGFQALFIAKRWAAPLTHPALCARPHTAQWWVRCVCFPVDHKHLLHTLAFSCSFSPGSRQPGGGGRVATQDPASKVPHLLPRSQTPSHNHSSNPPVFIFFFLKKQNKKGTNHPTGRQPRGCPRRGSTHAGLVPCAMPTPTAQ